MPPCIRTGGRRLGPVAQNESTARGELGHTVVLDNLEHLSHSLRSHGCPLFIISALNYDNYLCRIRPPPQGNENRPRRKRVRKKKEQHCGSQPANWQDDNSERSSLPKKKYDRTSPRSDATPKSDGLTSAGGEPFSTTDCQADLSQSLTQTSHSRRQCGEKNPAENVSRQHSDELRDDGGKSERSPTSSAACPFQGSPGLHGQEISCSSKDYVSGAWPRSSERKDRDDARTVTFREISSQQPSVKEGNDIPINSHAPTSAPPGKSVKREPSKKAVTKDNQTDTEAQERLRAVTNVPDTTSPGLGRPPVKPALPPRPRDMSDKGQRGDMDVVLLHQHCGVILMEVKSAGIPHGSWHYSDQEILDSVHKAVSQLQRGRDVFRFIMPDIVAALGITLVVALPFVSRDLLNKVLRNLELDHDAVFLCQDDLVSNSSQPVPTQDTLHFHTSGTGDEPVTSQREASSMLSWWRNTITPRGTALCLGHMKTIVGRVCGLLSVVSVWTRAKPRVEVRTRAQAISEAADRISDIVLLPDQADLLAQPLLPRLCLTGPMGSGKTLLLQLKGRQWLKQGRRVVVLNVRTSGRGRPAGHVMEEAIRRGDDNRQARAGSVERHDLAVKEFHMATFQAELGKTGPTDDLCFIVDELTHHTFPMLEQLMAAYPQCCIWCVAMFVRHLPAGFCHYRLGAVLRSPPSVQLLLKELDLNPVHSDVYSTRSAARGLPCDGPPIVFLHHQRHDTAIRNHDCVQCADDLVEVLQDTLDLQLPSLQSPQASTDAFNSPRKRRFPPAKAVEAKRLSFRDVLLLVCVPLGYYKLKEDGLWMAAKEDLYKFCSYLLSCPFFNRLKSHGVPLKAIIDNTSREIAFPHTDEIVFTDVMGVQSLERKVVIYLPGGSVLHSPEKDSARATDCDGPSNTAGSNQHVPGLPVLATAKAESSRDSCCLQSSTNSSPPASTALRTVWPKDSDALPKTNDASANSLESSKKKHSELGSVRSAGRKRDETDSKQDSLEVVNRLLKYASQDPSAMKGLFGNMMVDDTRSKGNNEQSQGHNRLSFAAAHKEPDRSDGQFRMGMDVRGDSPLLLSALADAQAAQEPSPSTTEEKKTYFRPDSVFPVSDVEEHVGHLEVERQRVRQALSCMSMDDQDWLFMAAARCLSQLVVLVP